MHVSITVPSSSITAVRTAVAQWVVWFDEDGNPCVNPAQRWALEGDVLTYTGQRHPMVQDGHAILCALTSVPMSWWHGAGVRADRFERLLDRLAMLEVVDYSTSNEGMRWYETYQPGLWRHNPLGDESPQLMTRAAMRRASQLECCEV